MKFSLLLLAWAPALIQLTSGAPNAPHDTRATPTVPGDIQIFKYSEANCGGNFVIHYYVRGMHYEAQDQVDKQVVRSFRLGRRLEGNEQLDFSVTGDLGHFGGFQDPRRCERYLQSFFARDGPGADACVNVSPSTCHRLWWN
ncbi:hypothetical protein BJX99DRAFT_264632 [Aspergillus californicus]